MPAAALFLFNLFLCRELLTIEFLDQPGSIEPAYIGLARYIRDNWRDLTWFPLWYGGIPFQNAYPPLLHVVVAAVSGLTGMTAGQAYHVTTAVIFALGPVALYWLALRLSGSAVAAMVSALLYTAWSPSALLAAHIGAELGGFPAGRRLQAMLHWGDGPHIASLTLAPVAIGLLGIAIERGGRWKLAAAAAMAAVALTNWIGALTLAVAVVCHLVANGGVRRALLVSLMAYGLAAPWIPPSTILVIRENARIIGGDYQATYAKLPLSVGAAVLATFVLDRLLRRWKAAAPLRFAILFAAVLSSITLGAEWMGVSLVPQAERYHLQMEMALCLVAGLTVRRRLVVAGVVAACLVAACLVAAIPIRGNVAGVHARAMDSRAAGLRRLPEWLESNGFRERVLLPGAASWYLAAFADTPQMEGGFSQGLTNPMIRYAWYAIISDADPGRCLLWLKALGVHAVGVSGEGSQEPYRPFRHPAKFEGKLEVLWREGPDVLYRVPHRSASLARVIRQSDAVTPQVDLLSYVAALEDASLPLASFAWVTRHSARIDAMLKPQHVVSVQMTHHPGWRATANGRKADVRRDGLGQILIVPACDGRCRIELEYDGGSEMRWARWAPWIVLLAGLLA